ncbi:MAG: glycoside hydrolase [Candidatus Dormibacteraeota bacterium]|nr:glycoside hydrolase [Candidatus Dormibacteraeota bacterium]
MKRVILAVPALVAFVAVASPGTAFGAAPGASRLTAAAPTASTPIRFGPTTVVDDQRAAGEPGTKVCGPTTTWSLGNCGGDNPYDTAPWGFSTTSTFIWRSEDRAHTFKLVPSNSTTGKPDVCPGGGDSDIAVSPGASQNADYLNFIDLQALNNFSSGVSRNGGQVFTCNPVAAFATAVDRQWFGVYHNTAGAPANGAVVYLDYDIITQHPLCATDAAANGNTFVVQKSTDGGTTWSTAAIADCNDGIAGNLQVNQQTAHVFAVHTAFSSPTQSVATDQITVNRSMDFGTTWTRAKVFSCNGNCVVGNDFAVLAIDKLGGLYSVWSQAPTDSTGAITGPSHIFYAYSGDDGQTWTAEQQVDHGTTDVNVFAWVAAGNAGSIDVVWYGTKKAATVPTYDSGAQSTDWFPYLAQSVNANGSAASFTAPVAVSQHPNHNGGICTNGIGCTAGGDRSLSDFFQVDVNQAGGADVTWADTSNNGSNYNNQGALIEHARQISGPTLYGGNLNGSLVVCTAVTSAPCQPDPRGDARYEADGVIGPNTPKLDITGSSVNLDPTDPSRLLVRLQVANLNTLPNATDGILGGAYVDYLTSWNYHIPGGTQETFDSTGNIYYAYLEVNLASGTVTGVYDGNTCSIATTHPKSLVYPGQNAISYRIDNASGTIDLFVPRAQVGNPPVGATLYSVTGHTVSQPLASGPFNCTTRDPNRNNQDPSGQIFNVYDKSAAYTSVLTVSSGTGCQEGDGGGEIHGKNGGNASFQSDEDGCQDGDVNGEQFKDSGAGEDFQSTEVRSVQHDNAAGTMTVSGVGLSKGLPVTYVIVEQAATALTPALYTIQLSDGYVNTGSLISGVITIH